MHASLYMEVKNDEKILFQISKSKYIEIRSAWKKSKMSYCTTLHVSWKWNYGGLKFMFAEAFCVVRMRNELCFSIGCIL